VNAIETIVGGHKSVNANSIKMHASTSSQPKKKRHKDEYRVK
jgi:hypothetical protein